MPFDIHTLKSRIADQLRGWWPRAKDASLTSVYAGFAAATMVPLVEEVQRGNLVGVAVLLGSLTSGVWGNLIAAQLERWRDKSQAPDEATLAAWIAEQCERSPENSSGLDEMLEKLGGPALVRQALPADEARALIQALRDDVARLGALPRFAATLSGDGAIAQAEAGGVAIAVHVVRNVYRGPEPRDTQEALAIYRRVLVRTLSSLSLHGLDEAVSDPTTEGGDLDLARVYIDLDTTASSDPSGETPLQPSRGGDERGTRPLAAIQAVARHPHVVLLGEPGSGKSTFVSHLALGLAAQALEPNTAWRERLRDWPPDDFDRVPITIVLRDYAASRAGKAAEKAGPHHLRGFLTRALARQNLKSADQALETALDSGKALVLLDGLDEIADPDARARVRDDVKAFIDRYGRSRHVVTCRTLSYQDKALRLPRLPSFQIALFDRERIERFIEAWYAELERVGAVETHVKAQKLGNQLHQAVQRPDLRRLAPNPLLLTVMAIVNTHKGQLPDARALVYRDVMDLLLWRREAKKAMGGDEPRLRKLIREAGPDETDFLQMLSQLAFNAQNSSRSGGADAVADIPEASLMTALRDLHPKNSYDWAAAVIDTMKHRAGLLLERQPGLFSFPHRTFQEYLAGVHLSTRGNFLDRAIELLDDGPYWLPTILLGVGHLVHVAQDTDKPLALVDRLCSHDVAGGDRAWRQAWFAGEVLCEFGVERAGRDEYRRGLTERVQKRLVALVESGRLSPPERAAAGNALGRLGDPRFRADRWWLPDEDLLGFIKVEAGPFTMGSNPKKDRYAQDDEQPQHVVELPDYYIARYPVTVAQFRAFVQDVQVDVGDRDLGAVPNHPVVRVSFDEALAYCRWLTERLRATAWTPPALRARLADGWVITLPSEAQWEKAARGADGRIYPWGDTFNASKANGGETGLGMTSTVGLFRDGVSPCKSLDMAGNVWEWTRSLWGKGVSEPDYRYPYEPTDPKREDLDAPNGTLRVLRGGSFNLTEDYLRAAFRHGDAPDFRNDFIGFRLVSSRLRP